METLSQSYYDILELGSNSTPEDIKKAYRRLSFKCHPDKTNNNPQLTEQFKKISEAYETLSDVRKKQQYDITINGPFGFMTSGSNIPMDLGITPDVILNMLIGDSMFWTIKYTSNICSGNNVIRKIIWIG